MAQPERSMGQGMSDVEFDRLCSKAREGNTGEVPAAVDQDLGLATRAVVVAGHC